MGRWNHRIRVALTSAVLAMVLWKGAAAQEGSEPLVLDHADSTEVYRHGDQTEYQLYGDVRFSQGTTHLRGNRAIWRPDVGVISFDGQVLVQQPARWIKAQSMTYDRAGRSVLATGDVQVEDTSQNFLLFSQRARFDRGRNVAIADSFPKVIWDFLLDSASQTIVTADTMVFERAVRRGVGIGTVRVSKGSWQARGDNGIIWPDSSRAILTGLPSASGTGGTISGDTLIMEFAGHGVHRVRAVGNATGVYSDTAAAGGGTNLLKGKTADFFVESDTLRAIRFVGQAFTDHQPADTTDGSNHASGDSLWLRFDHGRLATVTILGGAQGKYVSPRSGTGADTVDYKAATILFVPDSGRVELDNQGNLHYGTTVLDAGHITYWTARRTLLAHGIKPSDTAKVAQRPVLSDGKQTITGDQLTYNIDTRRGRIRGSSTQFEGAYYKGGDFRKYTDSVYFVSNGIYTTCDEDPPHFRFESRDMEIIRGDKIIARPVVLKIGELPVMELPYYVFPIRKGRHSGFLPLRFGNFTQGDRFIGNIGYYWAASQYWDVLGAMDYNDQAGSILFKSSVGYALRYRFSGNVSGQYTRQTSLGLTGQSTVTRWSLHGSHNQTLSPTASLAGSMDFISDKSFYQDYSTDPNDRRNRSLTSQLNFSKRWKGASVSAYVQNVSNLDTDTKTRRLPQVDFQMTQRQLFAPDSGQDQRWYQSAYVSYSSHLSQFQSITPRLGDTTGAKDEKRYATFDQQASLSFPQHLFHYISVAPNASLEETWYYVFDTPLARSSRTPVDDPGRRLSGSAGVSLNTNLYGFVNPHLWGLTTIRHTMTPRISYAFTPAIVQNNELRTYTGVGGGTALRSQFVSFSLSNVVDAKLFAGDKEKKVTLLNAGLSTSYNLAATSRKWGLLIGNARTSVAKLDLSVDATWDLYNQQTLDLQWTNPTLTSFGVSAATSLRSDISAFSSVTGIGEGSNRPDTASEPQKIPLNVSLSYRYSESRSLTFSSKDHWLGWRADFQPTKNWTVNYQQTYNWARHAVTDQRIEVTRDLHCWNAQFLWVPTGSGAGYYFRVGVKAIPDIKIERSESGVLGAFGRQF
jgi:lipopolysaccharide assembly outer membrane protein LptD (OstA)